MKAKSILILLTCCLLLNGCKAARPADPFRPEQAAPIQTLDKADGLKQKAFAADLCVCDGGSMNTDGVKASAFALFDLTGREVLSAENIYERVYPASVTKILTCLIAIERGNPDELVTVSDSIRIEVSGSSMADLRPGDRLPLRDLIYGMMVPSGNDAAVAIAEYISGSVSAFSDIMNEKAKNIGAVHSHFTNPHGLPDQDHYTTVYDLYLILNEALKHEEFLSYASQKTYTAVIGHPSDAALDNRQVTWVSTNQFYNGNYSFPDGLHIVAGKTGHTNAAGFCLAMGERSDDNRDYISIIMKAPTYEHLYNGMRTLVNKR